MGHRSIRAREAEQHDPRRSMLPATLGLACSKGALEGKTLLRLTASTGYGQSYLHACWRMGPICCISPSPILFFWLAWRALCGD